MSGDSELIGMWQAQDIGGRPLHDDVASTIVFADDGRVAWDSNRQFDHGVNSP